MISCLSLGKGKGIDFMGGLGMVGIGMGWLRLGCKERMWGKTTEIGKQLGVSVET